MNPLFSMSRTQRRATRTGATATRRASTVREWPVSGSGFPWNKIAFGWSLAGSECTINAGRLHIHGIGVVSFGATTVTLLAETCTVYAQCARASFFAGEIAVSASPAATSNTHYRFPLYTFTYVTETTSYETPPAIHHFGDLHLDAPVM